MEFYEKNGVQTLVNIMKLSTSEQVYEFAFVFFSSPSFFPLCFFFCFFLFLLLASRLLLPCLVLRCFFLCIFFSVLYFSYAFLSFVRFTNRYYQFSRFLPRWISDCEPQRSQAASSNRCSNA